MRRSEESQSLGVKFTGEIALTPIPRTERKRNQKILKAVVDEAKKAGVMVQVHAVSSTAK